jgi:hypothetical protein
MSSVLPTAARPSAGDSRPLSIGRVRLKQPLVRLYERAELDIELRCGNANPFDPAEIELNGLVTTPAGRRNVIPGFYTQEYTRRLVGDQEQLVPHGKPGWRLRICASELGTYRVTPLARDRSGRQVTARSISFLGVPSGRPGFVRKSARSPRYLAFDNGAPYVPIGANVCWGNGPGTFNYDRWFARYAAAKCTYSRLWLGPTWTTFGLERQGLGKIDLANAWRLDYVLNLAGKYGLYLMLCLDSYNELRHGRDGADPFWERTPHNAANGGPLRQPGEFWTNPQMERLYRNKLRYLVARYGASPNVLAWEFWNEVDIVSPDAWDEDQVRDWHVRMARYLRGLDPCRHLITTSFSGAAGKPSIDRLPELDYVQTHTYGAQDTTAEVLTRQREKAAYGKPHFVGEYGIGDSQGMDRTGNSLHNVLWSGLFSGGAGTGMLWWWDNYIDPNDLYGHFSAVSAFMQGIDLAQLDPQPMATRLSYAVTLPHPPLADIELTSTDRSWEASAANRPTQVWINGEGEVRIETALSGLLHGLKNHPRLHNPLTFHLDISRPTQLVVQVTGVSGYGGGRLAIRRNGQVVLDKEMMVPAGKDPGGTLHQYDGDYSVPVPDGSQTLEVENTGVDWMYVGYTLRNGRAATRPALRVLALSGARPPALSAGAANARPPAARVPARPDTALAWVQNPENEWYRVAVQKRAPRPVPPSLLELNGLADGSYQVTLWDTYRGAATRHLQLTTTKGALSVPLPTVQRDLALKAVRAE